MAEWSKATLALGKEIAKLLDEEKARPVLRMQTWAKIHEKIEAALAEAYCKGVQGS
jgi:hypothetical protein